MSAYTLATVTAEVERYLTGEIGVSDLEGWLIPLVWEKAGPEDVLDLAYEILFLRFQYADEHLSEQQFQDGLRELLPALALP